MKQKIFILLLLFATTAAEAQTRLKLFIDCNDVYCDYDFIRREIRLADFVRDRQQADVHILVISQPAGNGGQRIDILLLGQGDFARSRDTLHYFLQATSTEDESRKLMVKTIEAGVMSYFAKTGQLNKITIAYIADSSANEKKTTGDKWNSWVFSIGGRAQFSGDNNYKDNHLSVNSNASRVTENSKLSFSVYKSSASNSYSVDDIDSKWLRTRSTYMEAEQNFVKSISKKWSWAIQSEFRKSSYDNLESSVAIAPGIEYNIFPYKSSGNKFFALRYMINAIRRTYVEETIYGKKKETLFANDIGAYAYFTQPWGSISSQLTWYSYLHDMSKNNLAIDASVDLKLFKGVSLNFYGNASIIHDQLSLPKAGASAQDVLLRLKALSTNFNYYTAIGINYRFGSQFNNYVNPRFTNGRW